MANNYNTTLKSNNVDLQAILDTINELPDAGGSDPVLQDKTVTPTASKQTVTADSGYDGLDTVTVNAMPTATQATPAVSINSSTGLVTATATQTSGYVSAGTKSGTLQLAFQAAQTITPGTTNKTIAANTYLGGVQTIKGDANLVASNIVSGKSIFGVVGTATTGGGDTSIEDSIITKTVSTYTNDRVTTVGSYAFKDCKKLTTVSFPKCLGIDSNAFQGCSSLTTVSFPACTSIGSYAFYGCSKLKTASFPKCNSIGERAFYYCSLSKIYLGASSVCTLTNSNAFSHTSIWSNTGSIFVPASLLSSYKAATNWTFFSARIFSYTFT